MPNTHGKYCNMCHVENAAKDDFSPNYVSEIGGDGEEGWECGGRRVLAAIQTDLTTGGMLY